MASDFRFTSVNPRRLTAQPNFLSGWKDIANYLGKGVRTVQRYEQALRLPVRRPLGQTGASVIASPLELDAWVTKRAMKPQQAALNSQNVDDLRKGISEMHRLCAEGYDLMKSLSTKGTSTYSAIDSIVKTLSDRDFSLKTEKHRTIATEQEERAKQMIETARAMSARAIEMRKLPNPPPAVKMP